MDQATIAKWAEDLGEDLDEIGYFHKGERFHEEVLIVDRSYVGSSRWAESWEMVLKDNEENYWKLEFELPATEMQDQGPFEYNGGPEFVQVWPHEVIHVVYTTEPL